MPTLTLQGNLGAVGVARGGDVMAAVRSQDLARGHQAIEGTNAADTIILPG